MIKFVDENGVIYEGQSPYIHWVTGSGQSTGLWYNCKMFVISDQIGPLICEGLSEDGVFKFIRKDMIPTDPTEIADLSNITDTSTTDNENNIVNIEDIDYYIFQVLLVCKSDVSGQFTDTFQIRCIDGDPINVTVGADFYDPNEILGINLSNKGADIPIYVEKAIYDSNYKEANIDNILINRKFKELISNYIDVLDCKGSYKSLINSLEWFDWGDNIKMFEVWKGTDEMYFEKSLELILSQIYRSLLYTKSKTTYISLVSPLQRFTDELDIEKNPIIENIIQKWTNDEIAVKVSILGAFFERFFMPIHMDLKRASAEALVCTIPTRIRTGESIELADYIHDTGIVSINMPNTVILGNLDGSDEMHPKGVAVDKNTLFGKSVDVPEVNSPKYIFTEDFSINNPHLTSVKDILKYYLDWGCQNGMTWTSAEDMIRSDECIGKVFEYFDNLDYNGVNYDLWKLKLDDSQENDIYGLINHNTPYTEIKSKSLRSNLNNLDELDKFYCPFELIITGDGEGNYSTYSSLQSYTEIKKYSLIDINENFFTEPVGVTPLNDVTSDANSDDYAQHNQEVVDTYSQLIGNVGVVTPIDIVIDLPVGDGINMEMINVYKNLDFAHPYAQVVNRKYYAAEDLGDGGKVRMKFYLLSTREEEVSFSLMFTSLSGHVWTAVAGYNVVDVSGCKLSVCKVSNNDYTNIPGNFLDFMKGNPWATQYNTIKVTPYVSDVIDEDKYEGQILIQYLPYSRENIDQYNEIISIENKLVSNGLGVDIYDESWKNSVDIYITNNFWMLDVDDLIMNGNTQTHKRTILIKKSGGGNFDGVNYLSNELKSQVKRHEFVFIPQLHSYNDLDKMPLVIDEDGKYKSDNYKIKETDILCVIPQFKQSIKSKITDIRWEFINKTTLERVTYDIPLAKPMIANSKYKYLHPGYWSVIMRFKLGGVEHKISRNSAFIMI